MARWRRGNAVVCKTTMRGFESPSGLEHEIKLLLKKNPTLRDFQKYVAAMLKERRFRRQTVSDTFLLFLEECGEMAKAARKASKLKTDAHSEQFCIGHEVADIFIYLLEICGHYNIDLEKAFREKEEINKNRIWK